MISSGEPLAPFATGKPGFQSKPKGAAHRLPYRAGQPWGLEPSPAGGLQNPGRNGTFRTPGFYFCCVFRLCVWCQAPLAIYDENTLRFARDCRHGGDEKPRSRASREPRQLEHALSGHRGFHRGALARSPFFRRGTVYLLNPRQFLLQCCRQQ